MNTRKRGIGEERGEKGTRKGSMRKRKRGNLSSKKGVREELGKRVMKIGQEEGKQRGGKGEL